MEFPHLGTHCAEKTCRLLDFLPMKCDACEQLFCKDHILYSRHSCPNSYGKDKQVPVCPLCNLPIPVGRNELPDVRVGRHIDNDCQSDTAKNKRKIFVNKCSSRGCKQKELVRVTCNQCHQNFCLKHRHPTDHQCQPTSQAGAAAISRIPFGNNSDKKIPTRKVHQNFSTSQQMREDEALARALQLSTLENDNRWSQSNGTVNGQNLPAGGESEDMMLARAIAESERQYAKERSQRNNNNSQNSNSCVIT